jgi:hypothetical protein
MTVTADRPIRQNRDGDPCPPWCRTDHDKEVAPGIFACTHRTGLLRTALGYRGLLTSVSLHDGLEVHVSGLDEGMLFVQVRFAEGLAGLAELLAGATPDEHRQLAAAIRQAVAAATEAPGA